MELCKVTLTFESFKEFDRMKFENLVEICFWLNLAVKGLR